MEKVGIIGGGVIGMCTAWYLSEAGYQVTLLDRHSFQNGCSYGNAGMIVPSHFIPLAAPGMIWKGLKWLTQKESPLSIRPSINKDFLSWLYYFYQAGNKAKVEQAIPALLAKSRLSVSLYKELAANDQLDFNLHSRGILMQFLNPKTGITENQLAGRAIQLGLNVQTLNKDTLQQLQPGINYGSAGAFHYLDDAHIRPEKFLSALKMALLKRGVAFLANEDVRTLIREGDTLKAIVSTNGTHTFDQFIFCCGAWTTSLLKQLSVFVRVVSGKGYSFMIPNSIGLATPSLLIDHKVSITPMGDQIRIGGTMELGSANGRVNLNKIRGIVKAVNLYYPDLQLKVPDRSAI